MAIKVAEFSGNENTVEVNQTSATAFEIVVDGKVHSMIDFFEDAISNMEVAINKAKRLASIGEEEEIEEGFKVRQFSEDGFSVIDARGAVVAICDSLTREENRQSAHFAAWHHVDIARRVRQWEAME